MSNDVDWFPEGEAPLVPHPDEMSEGDAAWEQCDAELHTGDMPHWRHYEICQLSAGHRGPHEGSQHRWHNRDGEMSPSV